MSISHHLATDTTGLQISDGTPHLAYYDAASRLSFVWTGHLEDPILVQAGGYGEPAVALIDPAENFVPWELDPSELMTWFRTVCDTWNARWDGR
jgi:hypothetical protein